MRMRIWLWGVLLLFGGLVMAQDNLEYRNEVRFLYPAGWELESGAERVELNQGESRLIVVEPSALGNILSGQRIIENRSAGIGRSQAALSIVIAELGYTRLDVLEDDRTLATLVIESEDGALGGLAYLLSLQGNQQAAVLSLSTARFDAALDDATALLLQSISYPENIIDSLRADGRFSLFLQVLNTTGLDALLPTAEYTVFAPTDSAFNLTLALLGISASDLLADVPLLESLLRFHIVEGASLVAAGQSFSSLDGETLSISEQDGAFRVNDQASILRRNLVSTNGFLQFIDAVLIPPSLSDVLVLADPDSLDSLAPATPSILGLLSSRPELSAVLGGVEAAGLAAFLDQPGQYTFFAPTNAAFEALASLSEEELTLLSQEDIRADVILYHILASVVATDSLPDLDQAITGNRETLSVSNDDRGPLLGARARFVETGLIASNGVVHIIDAVLLPPSFIEATSGPGSLLDLIVNNPDLSILAQALETAGLTDTLNSQNELTLFAPTNAAFEAFLETSGLSVEELLANREVLTGTLLFHVVNNRLPSDSLAPLNSATVTTLLANNPLVLRRDGEQYIVNDQAAIGAPETEAANGLLYVIDTVLVPDSVATLLGTAQLCRIETEAANTVQVRVGPGLNRSVVVFLAAGEAFEVISQRRSDEDGLLWYELNTDAAAPGKLILEAWVQADLVQASGRCDLVIDRLSPPTVLADEPLDGG